MNYLEQNSNYTVESFVKAFNKMRLDNKNQWICFVGEIEGRYIEIKSFGTSIQILKVNGLKLHSTFDQKVGDWKYTIEQAIKG